MHSKAIVSLNKWWIISGIRKIFSEESLNQIKEENQTNISKRRVPKFFEFWEKVATATECTLIIVTMLQWNGNYFGCLFV